MAAGPALRRRIGVTVVLCAAMVAASAVAGVPRHQRLHTHAHATRQHPQHLPHHPQRQAPDEPTSLARQPRQQIPATGSGGRGAADEGDALESRHSVPSNIEVISPRAALTWGLEGTPCTSPADCALLNFNLSEQSSPLVRAPLCVPAISDNKNSTSVCTCGVSYCVSASSTYSDGTQYFYCGPCGRIGSSCSGNITCSHRLSECNGVQCTCKGGQFYDMYYCVIPYYGYEKALQVAIATCIFVALCLLIATVYSTLIGPRRAGPHPYLLRLLMRRANEGTRESPPGDTPPKYDDVVDEGGEAPPSYTQALELQQGSGECNLGYDNDSDSVNNSSSSSYDTSNGDTSEGDASNTPTTSDNSSNSFESTASREGSWNDVITLTRGSITIASISSSKNSDESAATVVSSHHTGAIPKRRKTSPKAQHQHEKVQQKEEPDIEIPSSSVPPSMTSSSSPPRSTPPELLLHATRL